jgi:Rrf2 family protein
MVGDIGHVQVVQENRLRAAGVAVSRPRQSLGYRKYSRDRFGIPLELLAKILQHLARHGMVSAHKGTHGGYQLARPANAISIAEVAQAIDGPMRLTACSPLDERCAQFAVCTVRDPLWRVRERLYSVLHTVTLDELDNPEHHDVPLTIWKEAPGVPVRFHDADH